MLRASTRGRTPMYQSIALFRTSAAMAQHAGDAQAQIARNIANADTPGYRAQSAVPFSKMIEQTSSTHMHATRPGHLTQSPTAATARLVDSGTEPAPNGNTVSLEDELLNSVQIGSEHKQALAIYRHTMTVLRTAIGR